ncbi:MAG TPA: hypothetical protein PKY30_26415, partial [Myxococcota bacterium]|nr:hypothetical protein [Myxococcota bacterium]
MVASSLFALILSAEAANVPKIKNIRVRQTADPTSGISYLDASTDDANAEIASMTAGLSQDGIVSALTLSPTNTGLAGESPIALPTRSATLTLTTLDANNLPLRSFRGWIEPDGSAGLEAELLCEEGSEPCIPVAAPDLEVLAIHAIDGTLALELVGSDTYDVALATLTITETTRGGEVCVQNDEFENCLEWT